MSIKSELASSFTGVLDQAIIEIHDFREAKKDKDPQAKMNGTKFALKNGGTAYSENFPSRFYKVQFNPSQLLLDCSAKTVVKKNVENLGEGNPQSVNIPSMTLSLKLYFDDMFTYDAFLTDRFNNLKNPINLAIKKKERKEDTKKSGKKEVVFSVQKDVEAFIAALRNPGTRCVTFRWADFTFHGQLNYINAQYTMFSPAGRPIRAVLTLRIKSEMDASALVDYYKNYASMFTDNGDVKRLPILDQFMGGALNVNL